MEPNTDLCEASSAAALSGAPFFGPSDSHRHRDGLLWSYPQHIPNRWLGNTRNLGYAFVNFDSPETAAMAARMLEGKEVGTEGAAKALKVSAARVQGFVANMERTAAMMERAGMRWEYMLGVGSGRSLLEEPE